MIIPKIVVETMQNSTSITIVVERELIVLNSLKTNLEYNIVNFRA
jgi:hypothetical protein